MKLHVVNASKKYKKNYIIFIAFYMKMSNFSIFNAKVILTFIEINHLNSLIIIIKKNWLDHNNNKPNNNNNNNKVSFRKK